MPQTSPHNPITSKDNAAIRLVRSLADPRNRKKERAFIMEGVKMVEEALRDDAGVRAVLATPALVQHHGKGVLGLAKDHSVEVLWISDVLMDQVSESKTPQPVMAIVRMPSYEESTLLERGSGLIVVAHQVQDPGNLGTIIRTCEASGVTGLAYSAHTVDPFNAKAVRASMGSVLRLPLVRVNDVQAFLRACRERGFVSLAAVVTATTPHFDVNLSQPTVVVLGQEGAGLPPEIEKAVDVRVRIPMATGVDSLNVAVSASVILYEAVRQRQRAGHT